VRKILSTQCRRKKRMSLSARITSWESLQSMQSSQAISHTDPIGEGLIRS
jgi:hypothetical protein